MGFSGEERPVRSDEVSAASMALRQRLVAELSFQISVDTSELAQGLVVARAAVAAGIDVIEMGTPLLKFEGVHRVIPAFRAAFPNAVLLADMKSMDGVGGEAEKVFAGGANIIDFLAVAGVDSARAACATRDRWRAADPATPRLVFADILLPHQGPAARAVEVAEHMVAAGVDGVGVHLQVDARLATPDLLTSSYFPDIAAAVFERVGREVSVQVVGGISIARAVGLRQRGLKAFVVSGNLGVADTQFRLGLGGEEIEPLVRGFIDEVKAG